MTKRILSAVLLLAVAAGAAQAAVHVPTRVTDVTLYVNQAQVHRTGKVRVTPGMNELLLDIHPFRLDPESVTARIMGDGQILGVQYKEIPAATAVQPDIVALEDELKRLEAQKQAAVDSKQTLSDQQRFLDAFLDFSKTQLAEDIRTQMPTPEDLAATLAFLGENYKGIREQMRTADQRIEDISREIDTVRRKLDQLRRHGENLDKVIAVLFNAATKQEIDIEATYTTPDAGWDPVYKAAVAGSLSGIDLTMFSRVVQITGEPWETVRLTVSNVIPLKGAALPDLGSWWIDLSRPVAKSMDAARVRTMAAPEPMLEMQDATSAEAPPRPAGFASAQKTETALSFEYTLPLPVSVESRSEETLLPVFSKRITGDFYHFAVPAQTPIAFLVAEAAADTELLPGPLNLYFDGRYVGKTHLTEKKAGTTFMMNLGADRQVLVKREKVLDKKDETFFGKIERGTVVRRIGYRLTAENLKARPVQLKILDHLPVSRTDKLTVEGIALDPPPAQSDYAGRPGVMMWDMEIVSGEKKTVSIDFEVSYPKDSPPFGL